MADWKSINGIGVGVISTSYPSVSSVSPNNKNMIFVFVDSNCNSTNSDKLVLNVNNTPVNMAVACTDNKWLYGATTNAGRKFIFYEFRNKNTVIIGSWDFSAKGFIKAKEKTEQLAKEAL